MIAVTPGMQSLIEQLLSLLDEDISVLNLRCSQLESLSQAILHRDDETLDDLLNEMEKAQQVQTITDVKLRAIRQAIANAVGRDVKELRLSRLIGELTAEQNLALDYRRQQIVLLTEKLRRQHLETAVVLSECARVNRMLLETLFPEGSTVTTYSTDGANPWRPDVGLVNAEF